MEIAGGPPPLGAFGDGTGIRLRARARIGARWDGHGLSRARPEARPAVAVKVLHAELAAARGG